MKPIRRILVGIGDPEARPQGAARKAAVLAEAFGAELVLFHAITVPMAAEPEVYRTGGLAALVVVAGAFLSALNSLRVAPGEAKASVQLYKNPNCSCCDGYAAYLRSHGYAVTTTPTHNLSLVRREHGVPVREDRDLVELLCACDVGDEIPLELYGAVAEILSWLYARNAELGPR